MKSRFFVFGDCVWVDECASGGELYDGGMVIALNEDYGG